MAIKKIDFTGVETSNLLPVGEHVVRVSDAKFTQASTGSDQLEIMFKDQGGRNIKAWYNLQPAALWKLKGFLENLGFTVEGTISLDTASIIGKSCIVCIEENETYNGNLRKEVTYTTAIQNQSQPEPQPEPKKEKVSITPEKKDGTNFMPPWLK